MNIEDAWNIVNLALKHQRLSHIQEQLFRQVWEGKTYIEISESLGYSRSYLYDVGYRLWQILTKAFDEKVTKQNLQAVVCSNSKKFSQVINSNNLDTINDYKPTPNNLSITSGSSSNDVAIVKFTEQRTARYFKEQLGNKIVLPMILVNGGKFMMGSSETEEEHLSVESPQHPVTVKTFFLGRYPVTQEQWQIVAETYPKVNLELNPKPSYFEGDNRPVEQVSWYEAQEYCDRLAQKTKRPYRLPTEAEWEYACRAGTETPFYFGKTISTELVNYDGNDTYVNGFKGEYREVTTPVDHFALANAWGLCDMHGNVLEWCQDHWHSGYNGASKDGSAWLTDNSDADRVTRGGSWDSFPGYCRSAYRDLNSPANRDYSLGFRVSCPDLRTL